MAKFVEKPKTVNECVAAFVKRKKFDLSLFQIEAPASKVTDFLVSEGALVEGQIVDKETLRNKFNAIILHTLTKGI